MLKVKKETCLFSYFLLQPSSAGGFKSVYHPVAALLKRLGRMSENGHHNSEVKHKSEKELNSTLSFHMPQSPSTELSEGL